MEMLTVCLGISTAVFLILSLLMYVTKYKTHGTLIVGDQEGDTGYGLILEEHIKTHQTFVVLKVHRGEFKTVKEG